MRNTEFDVPQQSRRSKVGRGLFIIGIILIAVGIFTASTAPTVTHTTFSSNDPFSAHVHRMHQMQVNRERTDTGMSILVWGIIATIAGLVIRAAARRKLAAAGGPAPVATLRCNNCGNALPPHARFCNRCGTKV